MAAPLPLYLDIVAGRFITSATNGQAIDPLTFFQGDIRSIIIRLLTPDPTGGIGAYSQPDISNMALSFEVADTEIGTTPLVTQFVWTKVNTGGDDPYFQAEIAFNTAPVTTFLNGQASATAFMEVQVTEGTAIQTYFHGSITLRSEIIKGSTSAVPPGQSAISLEQAVSMFVPFLGQAGQTITLVSPDGSHSIILGCNNDGSLMTDTI